MAVSNQEFLLTGVPSVDELKAKILGYRQRGKLLDQWLVKRLEVLLPELMKRSGIDSWVIINNEYNEDPLFWTLSTYDQITARRLTIILFHLNEEGKVERFSVTRYPMPNYKQLWTDQEKSQMATLAQTLRGWNVKKIGLNMSDTFAYADGLSHSLYEDFVKELSEEEKGKIVSAENIAVGWLETRIEEEMVAYNGIVGIAHAMIAEAFSNKVIHPGVTTADDVKYWMLQKTIDLGLEPWFDYEVSINRNGDTHLEGEEVILPGDILHCDVGFRYLNLCTDTQELCYILKDDEFDAPEDLKNGIRVTNRLQDIVIENLKIGKTGNEVLMDSLKQAKAEGIKPCIYTHPLGFHGHAAGPTIGLWDKQNGVEGSGDYPVHDNTAYSLELNATVYCETYQKELRFPMESDILLKDGRVCFLAGRQTDFHLVK
ncbi:MAG: M24 family metallopeptidase [Erysipelotrichaceae bacterium]|nr:M24 family metallopeptidase [Erysipelotrichaceae bacterium]